MSEEQDAETLHPVNPKKAREQAAEYLGFTAGVRFDLDDDETWELPNPSFLDPDQKMRYLEHQRVMAEDLDTKTETTKNPLSGVEESREVVKFPYRIDGELINEEELLLKALMGDDELYARFLKAGGVPGQVQVHWMKMDRELRERMKRDSKSS